MMSRNDRAEMQHQFSNLVDKIIDLAKGARADFPLVDDEYFANALYCAAQIVVSCYENYNTIAKDSDEE